MKTLINSPKNTFILEVHPNNRLKYIRKDIDEHTENHQCDTEMINAAMTKVPNSLMCPVPLFLKYLSKLHPKMNFYDNIQRIKMTLKMQTSGIDQQKLDKTLCLHS